MKALLRTVVILAALCLGAQTIRHVYVLWFQTRSSALDRYDQPLGDEIASATTVDELVRRYDPVRKEVDRVKAERRAVDPKAQFYDEQDAEPFKTEKALREAIDKWETRANEIHALRFYWLVGLLLAILGLASYLRANRWLGITLLIAGFSEFAYWTSPSLWGDPSREFNRLIVNKLVLSLLSLLLLALVTALIRAFQDDRDPSK